MEHTSGKAMQVLEIYQSKQGEGIWTGQPSVFVRFLGCPLRCRFCDTAYARLDDEEGIGANLTADEIVGRVLLLDLPHVVLTGGEPMLSPKIVELTRILKEFDYQITIETAGIFFQPVTCDLMSISPKLRNTIPFDRDLATIRAHERECFKPEIVQELILQHNHQLKFVVDTQEDLCDVVECVSSLHGIVPGRVLLMPQATDVDTMYQKMSWIEPFCNARGYRYCPRMQLLWYGKKRGT